MDDRKVFLIEMYKKMWDNITRHITVVWQSVAVLGGAIAALALVEKGTLPFDYAATLLVLVGAWQAAHVIDANFWYNRNLLIITNIERQFLNVDDLRKVHYYFEKHREPDLLDHFRIQVVFGPTVAGLVLLLHFASRVYPGMIAEGSTFEPTRAMPYAVAVAAPVLLRWAYNDQKRKYNELRKKSPGGDLQCVPTERTPGQPP